MPVHCYIRPPSGGWTEVTCVNVNFDNTAGSASATFNNVPDGYTVWVTVHLDYKLKGTKDPTLTPKSYTFTSSWSFDGAPTGADSSTLMGYPKKTTLIYGYVTDNAGAPIPGAQVTITLGGGVQCTYTTGLDGFYVFYAGQSYTGDGISCTSPTGTVSLPNASYMLSVSAAGYTGTSGSVNVNAQGKAFRKDWKLIAI